MSGVQYDETLRVRISKTGLDASPIDPGWQKCVTCGWVTPPETQVSREPGRWNVCEACQRTIVSVDLLKFARAEAPE